MLDLYNAPVGEFRRACGGNQQEEEQETCLEFAPIQGFKGAFAIRDSKNPKAGTLRFTAEELAAVGMNLTA